MAKIRKRKYYKDNGEEEVIVLSIYYLAIVEQLLKQSDILFCVCFVLLFVSVHCLI